jgi:leucine dehydrogenase
MAIFESREFEGHEEVVFTCDSCTGMRAIIAIHSTKLGPALGGCRMFRYACEADAVKDVLRLSRGMTYKAAAAGVALGGGKSVIIGDPREEKSRELLLAMGRAIERLNGRYIVGEDIGTNPEDMSVIREQTKSVSCLAESDSGYGDPAPLTALGVLQAIQAALVVVGGSDRLKNLTVAVQGVGNVGLNLCSLLAAEGAKLVVCDAYAENAARADLLGARIVSCDEIYAVDADVFAPCAIGATLNDETIIQLKAKIVAGAANNQLAEERHAELLKARGILYIPDYVANAGGLVSCAAEWYRSPRSAIRRDVLRIRETCSDIIRRSRESDQTTLMVADAFAESRLGLKSASSTLGR